MKTRLGRQESQMLAYLQMRRQCMVRTGELSGPLKLTPAQERELFRRMVRGGLIARVRPGLFLVPPRLPLGGAWSPDEGLALNTLMEDRRGRYQICGPNAFNRYGFDEQAPTGVWAYNNRISGRRAIGAVSLTLIRVADRRLGSTKTVRKPDGQSIIYASRVRTLVDAVYDWARFNSLPRGFDWIRRDLAAGRVTAADLVDTALRFGNRSTLRRIGCLLDKERVPGKLLDRLLRALPASSGLIPWNPGAPKRGTVNRRWGVVVNERV